MHSLQRNNFNWYSRLPARVGKHHYWSYDQICGVFFFLLILGDTSGTVKSRYTVRNLDLRKNRDIRNFLPITNSSLHSKSQYKNFFEKVKYRYKNFFAKIFQSFWSQSKKKKHSQQQNNQAVNIFFSIRWIFT